MVMPHLIESVLIILAYTESDAGKEKCVCVCFFFFFLELFKESVHYQYDGEISDGFGAWKLQLLMLCQFSYLLMQDFQN